MERHLVEPNFIKKKKCTAKTVHIKMKYFKPLLTQNILARCFYTKLLPSNLA